MVGFLRIRLISMRGYLCSKCPWPFRLCASSNGGLVVPLAAVTQTCVWFLFAGFVHPQGATFVTFVAQAWWPGSGTCVRRSCKYQLALRVGHVCAPFVQVPTGAPCRAWQGKTAHPPCTLCFSELHRDADSSTLPCLVLLRRMHGLVQLGPCGGS